jgi:hypothetical protein
MEIRQYLSRVTLTTDIFFVNGVLYFNLHSVNKHVLEIKETSGKIPGVYLREPTKSAKITGVYTDQEPMLPELNGSCWN